MKTLLNTLLLLSTGILSLNAAEINTVNPSAMQATNKSVAKTATPVTYATTATPTVAPEPEDPASAEQGSIKLHRIAVGPQQTAAHFSTLNG